MKNRPFQNENLNYSRKLLENKKVLIEAKKGDSKLFYLKK